MILKDKRTAGEKEPPTLGPLWAHAGLAWAELSARGWTTYWFPSVAFESHLMRVLLVTEWKSMAFVILPTLLNFALL